MIDPTIIIAASLWCGVPNLPMSSPKRDEQINQCRKAFVECAIGSQEKPNPQPYIPEECLNVKLRK